MRTNQLSWLLVRSNCHRKSFFVAALAAVFYCSALLAPAELVLAQATVCTNATKFCADAPVTFPAGTTGAAEAGNNYGCLGSQPAPAWFYFEVEEAGPINLLFTNSNSVDIDYALWGPYSTLEEALNDCGTLGPPAGATTGNPLQCSFSGGATESATVNAAAGDIYIMLVTNFAQQPTDISVAQSGGTGTITCAGVSGVGFTMQSPAYFPWNGFLEQINVLALANPSGADTAQITVDLLNLDGQTLGTQQLTLPPHAEFDLIVNELTGFNSAAYGLLKVTFTPAGALDAHLALYRRNSDGSAFEFANIIEAENQLSGASFASFNTHYPQRGAEDRGRSVNWLQLANYDSWTRSFTVRRHDAEGSQISNTSIEIPPNGRRDILVGNTDTDGRQAGVVQIIPEDSFAPYGGEVVRYGYLNTAAASASREYSFAASEKIGNDTSGYVPVSRGAGADNFVEISNIGDSSGSVIVQVYDSDQAVTPVLSQNITVPAKGQRHVSLGESLASGKVGFAEAISATTSLRVSSASYFYRADGLTVSGATISRGHSPLAAAARGFFNTFFGQLNWVKLFNIGGTATSVVIEAFDLDGVSLGSVNVALDAIKGKDVELRALGFNPRTNGYGFFTVSPADANVVVADVLRVNNSADEISVDEGNILPIR